MKKELKKVVQNELNPNVSVDCVIFGFDLERLTVLLIDRGGNTKNIGPRLALPGNLIYNNENIDQAANRIVLRSFSLINSWFIDFSALKGTHFGICDSSFSPDRRWRGLIGHLSGNRLHQTSAWLSYA